VSSLCSATITRFFIIRSAARVFFNLYSVVETLVTAILRLVRLCICNALSSHQQEFPPHGRKWATLSGILKIFVTLCMVDESHKASNKPHSSSSRSSSINNVSSHLRTSHTPGYAASHHLTGVVHCLHRTEWITVKACCGNFRFMARDEWRMQEMVPKYCGQLEMNKQHRTADR
jgi:hypothetical protein